MSTMVDRCICHLIIDTYPDPDCPQYQAHLDEADALYADLRAQEATGSQPPTPIAERQTSVKRCPTGLGPESMEGIYVSYSKWPMMTRPYIRLDHQGCSEPLDIHAYRTCEHWAQAHQTPNCHHHQTPGAHP